MRHLSRRDFLFAGISAPAALAASAASSLPLVDYHVHLNPSFTLDDAVALSAQRGVKFGIAEHAGTKENKYRVILSDDRELEQWMARLEGKPVYKGIQAEWLDWMSCFSKETVARLDFVLSDAMTIPGPNGERLMMWLRGFDPGDPQEFMDRYVAWNVKVIETEPLDIFAHPTWLPAPLDRNYDALWTPERMKPIVAALKRTGTAVEIDSAYDIPRMPFLEMAKDAGLKFSFGSNSGAGPANAMDFCLDTARNLKLAKKDFFVPAPRARKPIMRRRAVS
ncbi:MAG: hypothetical protein KIT09_22350 [Bryobacteraceae bacterium]|nr:hypothetical protein [Bryobacteraceae bacterium]